MKTYFLMDMKNREFTNDGFLSIRAWFKRMVDQFETNASRAGLDWNSAEMYLVMHPNVWDYVVQTYASYKIDGFILPENEVQIYRLEYMTRRALPIGGRWYPVVLDSQISQIVDQNNGDCSNIYFITSRIGGEYIIQGQYQDLKPLPGKPFLSGIIQNVRAKEEVTNENI